MNTKHGKHILLSIVALFIALFWFEFSDMDRWLQNLLFNSQNNTWIISKPGQLVNFIFYDGIKGLLVVFAATLIISLFVFKNSTWVKQYQHGLRIVLLALIVVPSVIGLLKATTNVACPRDLTSYGGNIPYIKVFESYPVASQPDEKQRCFPAGHASGGFALMALFYLFQSKRNRRLGLIFGLCVGWTMGTYKMLLGHHFLSHTVITMIIAWLLINLIVMITSIITNRRKAYLEQQAELS